MRIIRIGSDKKTTITEMTNEFDYNYEISKPGFFNEYKYLYGSDIKIDTTMV